MDLETSFQALRDGGDHGQEIIEIVRDAAAKLADRGANAQGRPGRGPDQKQIHGVKSLPERALRFMLPIKLFYGQLNKLRIIEGEPRTQNDKFLYVTPFEITADMF